MASVQKRSNGTWRARYRDPDGSEHARHFERRADAERWLDAVRGDLVRGSWVDPRAGRETFADYAARWRAAQPHRAGTARLYERTLRLHVLPRLGHRPIASLRRTDVQALVTAMSQDLAPHTVDNAYKLVRAVLAAAVDDGLLATSPARKIARQAVERRDVVPLEADQVYALVAALPDRYRALVLLAVGTGLRQGEVLGLTVPEVDFLRREVHVRHQLVSVPGTPYHLGPPKTPSSRRVVPAPDFVLESLGRHVGTHPRGPWDLVFANTAGAPVSRSSFHRSWAAAVVTAGIPTRTTFHDLRHTYASALIDGGESVSVVAARLGHKNATETLRTYSHLWPSSDERTRQVVERAFAAKAASISLSTALEGSSRT